MIKTKIIKPGNGVNYISFSDFTFSEPFLVTVDGEQQDISTIETGNRKCRFSSGEGRIYFENDFNGLQKVNVKYRDIYS